ncbi:hypothetical protein [Geodermatophilus sp. SYSU D00710]
MTRAPLSAAAASGLVGAAVARRLAPATAVLAVAVAGLAVLGPLPAGGTELVCLVAVAPLTLLAAVLVRRRSPAGPLLALGTSLAAGYLTAGYLVAGLVRGPDGGGTPGHDAAPVPLSGAVLALCATVALLSWWAVPPATAAFDRRSRRLIGVLLLAAVVPAVAGPYLPAWPAAVPGAPTADHLDGPALRWAVALADLVLLLPAAAATGAGLLRGARWAGPAAFAVSGCLALVGAAEAATTWSAVLYGDAGATAGTALTTTAVAAVTATPALLCWTAVVRTRRQHWAVPGPRREVGVVPPARPATRGGTAGIPVPRAGDGRRGLP